MSGLYVNAVVEGCFRQCPACERWYRISSFSSGYKGGRCAQCHRSAIAPHSSGRNRSYALTDQARKFLAAERHVA